MFCTLIYFVSFSVRFSVVTSLHFTCTDAQTDALMVGFQVLMALNVTVSWDVVQCSLVEVRIGGADGGSSMYL
jgi:hypothetical protein